MKSILVSQSVEHYKNADNLRNIIIEFNSRTLNFRIHHPDESGPKAMKIGIHGSVKLAYLETINR